MPNSFNALKKIWGDSGFKKYLNNTSWAFFGRFFSLGISFLTTIYVIRYLGPENYGLLMFSISFVGLFSAISTLGLDNILYRELSSDPSKKDQLLGTSFFLKIIASLSAFILVMTSAFVLKTDQITTVLILINAISLLFTPFIVIGLFFQSIVKQKYQALSIIAVTVILNVLKLFVIVFNKGIIYFASIFLLEQIIYAVIVLIIYKKLGNHVFKWTVNKLVAISLIRDSWPLMLSSAFVLVYTRIDQVMLKFITNNFNVGIYDAAARISEVWYFIPTLIISSVLPAIVNSKKVGTAFLEDRMIKLYSLIFYAAIFVAIPISFFSESIIQFIYGEEFILGAKVLSIYVWSGIPVFLTIAINVYLLTINKTKISFITSAVGMVTNIILNLTLIPYYGVQGAAISTLISYSLMPLSIIFFKESRNQIVLIKRGIMYPVNLLYYFYKN